MLLSAGSRDAFGRTWEQVRTLIAAVGDAKLRGEALAAHLQELGSGVGGRQPLDGSWPVRPAAGARAGTGALARAGSPPMAARDLRRAASRRAGSRGHRRRDEPSVPRAPRRGSHHGARGPAGLVRRRCVGRARPVRAARRGRGAGLGSDPRCGDPEPSPSPRGVARPAAARRRRDCEAARRRCGGDDTVQPTRVPRSSGVLPRRRRSRFRDAGCRARDRARSGGTRRVPDARGVQRDQPRSSTNRERCTGGACSSCRPKPSCGSRTRRR